MPVPDPLHIGFLIPPAAQRKGGLDKAVEGIRCAVESTPDVRVSIHESITPNLAECPPDVLHFHGLWQPQHIRAYRFARKRNIPYVVSPHGMMEPYAWQSKAWKKRPWYRLIESQNLAKASTLLATSTIEKESIHHIHPYPVETLPLGFTPPSLPDRLTARKKLGIEPNEKVILYLSRLDPKKGLRLLLEALNTLPKPPAAVRFLIVGDGPPSEELWLKQHLQAGNVQGVPGAWVGGVWGEKRWDYFVAADLFCLPTFSENFGIAVLEALAAGTPVLTTPYTPWKELVEVDGVIMTEPEVSKLRSDLNQWGHSTPWSEPQRQALQKFTRARYSWERLATAYTEFYRTIAPTDLSR